jgi:hypothetical protein
MYVRVYGITGPVPADDNLHVELREAATGLPIVGGDIFNPTPGVAQVVLGYQEHNGLIYPGQLRGWPDGTVTAIYAIQTHSSGVVVDLGFASPYSTWDPTSAAWSLLRYGTASGAADMAAILAAVRHTFPTTS